jgi:hypothetical protein
LQPNVDKLQMTSLGASIFFVLSAAVTMTIDAYYTW